MGAPSTWTDGLAQHACVDVGRPSRPRQDDDFRAVLADRVADEVLEMTKVLFDRAQLQGGLDCCDTH